jgi:hypothetical protein
MLVRHVALWRQDVERADAEGRSPALRGGDHVVDHEPHLEKGVRTFRPGLLVEAVRDRRHVLVLCQASSGWQAEALFLPLGGPHQHLLHRGGNKMTGLVMHHAAYQTTVARDRKCLLRVEVPALEADGAVEPHIVVEARSAQ